MRDIVPLVIKMPGGERALVIMYYFKFFLQLSDVKCYYTFRCPSESSKLILFILIRL